MNSSNLGSGDNSNSSSPRYEGSRMNSQNTTGEDIDNHESCTDNITPEIIDQHEIKMKERIAQCKNIIESLKLQLNEEKEKFKTDIKPEHTEQPHEQIRYKTLDTEIHVEDYGNSSMYSASVDSKLYCDENLIEYEKQLQKYQDTLNIAQNEKKNAIRKQMLAKAFKLKLMEVENQCNIELLRVKQSLQCLEPLQMIASKWKTSTEDSFYDINNYELIPNFPEIYTSSTSDINNFKEENLQVAIEACQNVSKDECTLSNVIE